MGNPDEPWVVAQFEKSLWESVVVRFGLNGYWRDRFCLLGMAMPYQCLMHNSIHDEWTAVQFVSIL
jgi:hypothetical protein